MNNPIIEMSITNPAEETFWLVVVVVLSLIYAVVAMLSKAERGKDA